MQGGRRYLAVGTFVSLQCLPWLEFGMSRSCNFFGKQKHRVDNHLAAWIKWMWVSLFDFRTLRTEFCLDLRKQQSYKHYIGFSRSLKAPWITYTGSPWKVNGNFFSMRLDCEQALSFLYKVTPSVTHARERPSRDNEFFVTSFFAIALAGIRPGRIFREKVDCKQFTMGCSMNFPPEMWLADWEQRYVAYIPQYSFFLALARSRITVKIIDTL